MKSLVVTEISKQINDNGLENILDTNQIKFNFEKIISSTIRFQVKTLSVDWDTFGTGTSNIYRDNGVWKQMGSTVDISELGITVIGDAQNGDSFRVIGEDKSWIYESNFPVTIQSADETVDYINIKTDKECTIQVLDGQDNFAYFKNACSFFSQPINANFVIRTTSTEDIEAKIIVAKVI